MSELKKWLRVKRILAMVLAVAMVVTSAPVTARAAEQGEVPQAVEAEVEETSMEEDAGGGEVPVIEAEGDTATVEDVPSQEEGEAEQQPSVDDEQDGTENADLSGEEVTAGEVTEPVEDADASANENPEGNTEVGNTEEGGQSTSDVMSAGEQKEAAGYEFKVELDPSIDLKKEYHQGQAQFALESGKPNSAILSKISLSNDGVNWTKLNSSGPVVDTVTYAWQKEDGTALGEGVAPKNVGKYKLVITLPAKEDAYGAATTTVEGFEITKAVITMTSYDVWVKAGTLVRDAAKEAADNTYIVSSDEKDFYSELTETDGIEFATVIKKADKDDGVSLDEPLVMTQEYVVVAQDAKFTGAWVKYAENYEFAYKSAKVIVNDLKETAVRLTLDEAYGNTYSKKEYEDYSDSKVKITKITVPYEAAGKVPAGVSDLDSKLKKTAVELVSQTNEQGEEIVTDKEIPTAQDAEWEGAWYNASFNDRTDVTTEGAQARASVSVRGKIDDAPKTAGTYVYRVTYPGDKQIYGESYADIVVEIGKIELVIKPELSETDFFGGQTAQDVLAKVTAQVLNAGDDSPFTIPEDLKDRFWGTSYADSSKTQPYQPTFEVYRVTKNAEDVVVSERRLAEGAELEYTLPEGSTDKVSYEVRFSGRKAVYSAGGSAYETDINDEYSYTADSFDTSYYVKSDDDTRKNAKYVASFTVTEGEVAEIDTSDIGASITEKTALVYDALTKTYDGKMLFVNRGDYKKAKLKDGKSSNPIEDYTYTWYYNDVYRTVEEATVLGGEDGKTPILASNFDNYWEKTNFVSPTDAGIYRLQIEYTDPAGKVKAKTANVYFVIKQQELKINLVKKEGGYSEFSGITVRKFLNDAEIGFTVTPELTEPSKAEDWKNGNELDEDEWGDYIYYPSYEVEVLQKNEDGTDKDGSDENNWDSTSWRDSFDAGYTYRLVVGDFDIDGYKGYGNFKAVPGEVATDTITITAMGTTRLDIVDAQDQAWVEKGRSTVYDGESIIAKEEIKQDIAGLASSFKLVKVNADGTQEPVSGVELTYEVSFSSYGSLKDWSKSYTGTLPQEADAWADAVNAGTYTISVSFRGNETYASMPEVVLETIEVAKKELIVNAPKLTVEAGSNYSKVVSAARTAFLANDTADVTGYAAADKKYFEKELNKQGFAAWPWNGAPSFTVYDKTGSIYNDTLNEVGDKSYTLKMSASGSMSSLCGNNYKCVAGESVPITVARGSSMVQATSYSYLSYVTRTAVSDRISTVEEDAYKHTVTTLNAIPYNRYYDSTAGKYVEGNWIAVRIYAPLVYANNGAIWSNAVYEKAIENAGGKIVDGYSYGSVDGSSRSYRIVLFNAAGKNDADFNIRWKDGDIEQFSFKFSQSECMENLADAVAPKSLAFNSPNKTMAVGERQELDVKIKKEQYADIIYLGYEVDEAGKDFLHIDKYGEVIALKEGKATVTVYPMHEVDGKAEKLDTKVKATVTITVKNVTAPKINKVTMTDTKMTVQYSLVNDGYRREVYVMEGKNVPASTFDTEISKMKNGKWRGVFAAQPRYISPSSEKSSSNGVWDAKKKAYVAAQCTFTGLTNSKEYTVYVRNVSATRTLSDGCKVQSRFAGSVKGFVMTKPQVAALDISLKEGTYTELVDEESKEYKVLLVSDKPQIDATGFFPDLNKWAEGGDRTIGYPLPLKDAQAKKDFVAPKISYYIEGYFPYGGYDALGRYIEEGEYGYVTKSSEADINNSGKITLKQPGGIWVRAYDSTAGVWSNELYIEIIAEADQIKAKSVTLSVGQSIKLENMVDYKQKGKTLDQSYYIVDNRIDRVAVSSQLKDNADFKLSDNGYVTAYGKNSISLTLRDKFLGQEVVVNLKSTDLAPVKGLTVINLTDRAAVVQFEGNPYASAYRIDVCDGRKTLIRSAYVAVASNDLWITNNGEPRDSKKYKEYCNYSLSGLTQQSKYSVTVTALFDKAPSKISEYAGVASKPATKAFATTKLPASYWDLGEYGYSGYDEDEGVHYGIQIKVRNNQDYVIDEYPFVSGNTYTLVTDMHNKGAQYAATDTLIWTSSDSKVATVKANAGSYSATLNAVKTGLTKIEVRSSITKRVIARYWIYVWTVGDAYTQYQHDGGGRYPDSPWYYGENEDLLDVDYSYDD